MAKVSAYELISDMPREEFTRDQLMRALVNRGYSRPDDRIASLVREGSIIRLAKGWYASGATFRRRPLHLRWLSNIMYVSCLSLSYGLSYWGLIPEHVEAFTAITPLRGATFDTGAGRFIYSQVPDAAFGPGRVIADVKDITGSEERFFIAAPDKALADFVWSDKRVKIPVDWSSYLFEDIRLERRSIETMNPAAMLGYARVYGSRKLASLASWLSEKGGA